MANCTNHYLKFLPPVESDRLLMINQNDCFSGMPERGTSSRQMPAHPGPGSGSNVPVVPLPPIVGNPESPPGSNIPSIPLPPIVGSPEAPPGSDIPMIPLPPIVGTPESPGSNIPVIPLPPIVGTPESPGNQARYCRVRFLHAAPQEGSFNISIGSVRVASNLSFGNFSEYRFVPDGFRVITIMTARSPRMILFQRSLPFRAGDIITLAIINTVNGIELSQISDRGCSRSNGTSCLRMANLVYNSPPLDLLLNDFRVVFSDVRYKETTAFSRIRPGNYGFFLSQTPGVPTPFMDDVEIMEDIPRMVSERYFPGYGEVVPLISLLLRVRPNTMYTIYVLGGVESPSDLQVLVAENY